MIGFYNFTVILTYTSVFSACAAMYFASTGNIKMAIVALLVSGLCDMFDGTVARLKKDRTEQEKKFGIQIDSLADVISFGISPAVIIYYISLFNAASQTWMVIVSMIAGFALVICAIIRLAFFNVQEEERQKTEGAKKRTSYRGLPVTNVSIILPIASLSSYFLEGFAFAVCMTAFCAITAFLYVLDFKMVKLHGKKLIPVTIAGIIVFVLVLLSPLAGFEDSFMLL